MILRRGPIKSIPFRQKTEIRTICTENNLGQIEFYVLTHLGVVLLIVPYSDRECLNS